MAITIGKRIVFGLPDVILPMVGFPAGKTRFRFRNEQPAKAFTRTECGVKQFLIEVKDGKWEPLLVAENLAK